MKQFGEKKPLMKQFGAQTSFDETVRGKKPLMKQFGAQTSFDETVRGKEAFDETVRGTNVL